MNNKLSINLLQPALLPEKPTVTLTRLVVVSLIIFVFMIAWVFFSHFKLEKLSTHITHLTAQEEIHKATLAELQDELSNQKQDPALLAKLNTLKFLMKNKQALHAKLTDPNRTYVAGFAEAMSELAKYHHKGISLSKVAIAQDQMAFAGLAKNANAVPQWLAGFERSVFLSGKHFTHFKLFQNEQKITEFEISSRNDAPVEGAE